MEPSAFCFSPDYVIFKRELLLVYNPTGYTYKNYRYNFATKEVDTFNNVFGTNDRAFTVPDGTFIDYFQYNSTQVFKIYTSGDIVFGILINNAKLLKVEAGTDSLTYWIFKTDTKTAESIIDSTLIPCHPGFSLTEDVVLSASCDGYTRNEYYHNGEGGINIVSTPNSTICGYVDPVENTDLTVSQLVRIEHCEPINPVMLIWKNTLGGWDQWLFSKRQQLYTDTESKGFVGVPIWDIESAEETQKEIGKSKANSMTLGADNLSLQERIGIDGILDSNIVYQLFKDGTKRRVSVVPGSFPPIDTSSLMHNIEFTITLPDSYTLSN